MAVTLDLPDTAWFVQWYGKEQAVIDEITFCAVLLA
jgi:hypothetical protein